MQDWEQIVERTKQRYDVRVRKWRARDERVCLARRLLRRTFDQLDRSAAPETPISLAIFLHEVGHHAIGFDIYEEGCEEEYHAWSWAIHQMRGLGVEPDERVDRRFRLSMEYAVSKAVRRGVEQLPDPLHQFLAAA